MQLEPTIYRYLDYARHQQHRRPLTVRKYGYYLDFLHRFMVDHYPDLALEDITIAHLDEFVTTTSRERQHTPATTGVLITALRSFFRYLVRIKLLEQSPARELTPPRRKKREADVLTVPQVWRLLGLRLEPAGAPRGRRPGFDYNRRNQLTIRLFLSSGIRRAELCALRWKHLDLTAAPPTLKVVQGKGGNDRTVPLLSWTAQELARYQADRGAGPEDPVFASAQGKPLKPDAITYMFVRLVTPAMGQRVTPHMLRHTYATLLSNNGVDVLHVQKLLGHSQVSTTQIYVHSGMEQLVAAIQHLPLAQLAWQPPLPLEM
ncbi:MAG: tyrosine-type recombinase/integrase [Chloroflexi bacterium]|nr:tyrosine-type recombinase/integrase [Chloroflexota bacterium]